MKILYAAVALTLLLAAGLDAQRAATAVDPRLAQLTLPAGSGADWRQWDSFLTNVVKKLATDLPESRRAQLQARPPSPASANEAFWAKFSSVSSAKEIGVKSCYGS